MPPIARTALKDTAKARPIAHPVLASRGIHLDLDLDEMKFDARVLHAVAEVGQCLEGARQSYADEADREDERNQRQIIGRGKFREREPGQSIRDLSDDADPLARPELESRDDDPTDNHHEDRSALRQRLRQCMWE